VCEVGILQLKLIKELLNSNGITYEVSEHEPVYTSEQAAKVRGVELKTGVKALVLKTEEGSFVMGLIAADKRIDLEKLAKIARTRKLRLASPQEVLKTTGCEVGSVHPFGNLHRLPTYLDSSILENNMVNFNAGLHTVSIQMEAKDLVKAIRPVVEIFSKI
jgi:Ala-tRNA(Pro) deacylase